MGAHPNRIYDPKFLQIHIYSSDPRIGGKDADADAIYNKLGYLEDVLGADHEYKVKIVLKFTGSRIIGTVK